MFVMESADVNKNGNLTIGGVDTIELCKKYGTPLYVIDEDVISAKCAMYKSAIDKYYNGNGKILYASKALSTVSMYKLIKKCGLGIDVVSGGELYTARLAGTNMEDVYFHGNNKTDSELEMAVEYGVSRIVVDNKEELIRLNELGSKYGKKIDVLFRIKPGIDAHTHDFIMTGQIDSKFGVALENNEAYEIMVKAAQMKNINVVGVHCHIGSQIFDVGPFELAAGVMLEFMAKVRDELGIDLKELNLGGGFGIKYVDSDDPVEYDEFIRMVSLVVKKVCNEHDMPLPKILMEPGRSIVGAAGLTLYKIGSVKTIENVRTYVAVDGGMCDNPRYALYKSSYQVVVANKAAQKPDFVATIAGKCCESGDLLQEHTKIQEPEAGDYLAVLATGAYNYSMSSNYNRNLKPAMVAICNGEHRLVVNRESYEDIVKNDIL